MEILKKRPTPIIIVIIPVILFSSCTATHKAHHRSTEKNMKGHIEYAIDNHKAKTYALV